MSLYFEAINCFMIRVSVFMFFAAGLIVLVKAIVINKTKDTHDLNTLAGWKHRADENGTNLPNAFLSYRELTGGGGE
ncbi:MAG: hypothetical protein EOM51_11045 [Clostridia bacterium]|nr:hypothetical protein [Clostridia bacterium]